MAGCTGPPIHASTMGCGYTRPIHGGIERPRKQFNGRIALDIRDAKPGWPLYEPIKAAPGSPNVLYIVLDDVGFGAPRLPRGMIETPNISRLDADGGLVTAN